jgi:cytochrome c
MRTKLIFVLTVALAAVVVVSGAVTGQDVKKTEAELALEKAVKLGRTIFTDKKLGKSGKSCADCHEKEARPKLHLKSRVGDYPKWERREKKVIILGQKLNQMIKRMVKGKEETLGSERLVALEAYLMSISRK